MLPASRRVESAWMRLEERGAPPAELLSADIYDSWMRCISLGLNTLRPPEPEFVSPVVLRQEQQRCSLVRGLALAEMHTLHQQIAGSNFMIAFANADGLLLDIISDSSFSDASNAACIRAGAIWTENVCGTNGLGTAAYLKRPIVVHGREHFFARYNNLTCIAAPIFAPDGELTGILDASSDCMSRQAHTQALVAMAAAKLGQKKEALEASVPNVELNWRLGPKEIEESKIYAEHMLALKQIKHIPDFATFIDTSFVDALKPT